MISKKCFDSLGLSDSQTNALTRMLSQEQHFKDVLRKAGVHHIAIDKIASITDISKLNGLDDDTLTEMIKIEWADFIPNKNTGR